jgi:outer membrane receptor for ferrienterochelin and colicins
MRRRTVSRKSVLARSCIPALCAAAMLASAAHAQAQQAGTVTGRVTAAARGTALEGITIVARGTRGTVTDGEGRYVLTGVPAGQDTIEFRWLGYRPRREALTIVAGQTRNLDIVLEPAPVRLGEVLVTAASRQPERIVDAPAAISVVEPARVREMAGTGQVPLLVADLPGVHAPQSGINDFSVNARGFNTTTNRRLLVLVDGRDVSVPLLGNQDWAGVSAIEDGTRVELLRGPGSALYGANAFSGVLAITTPSVREALGSRLSLTAGELATRRVDGRQAALFGGDQWGYRVAAGYAKSQSWDQSRTNLGDFAREYDQAGVTVGATQVPAPGYEVLPLFGQTKQGPFGLPGAATGTPDPARSMYGTGRVDYYARTGSYVTIEGGATRLENVVGMNSTGRAQAEGVNLPWARLAWSGDQFSLGAWYSGRAGRSRSLAAGTEARDVDGTVHVEGQINRRFAAGRGRVVVGGSVRHTTVNSRGTLLDPAADGRTDRFDAIFEQVDFAIAPKLSLIVGGRLDEGTLHDTQFSPKLGIVYAPRENQSLRVTANRGFLTPSALERFLFFPAGPPLDLSQLEAGLRASPLGPAMQGVPVGTLFTNSSAVPILGIGNPKKKAERVNGMELGYKGAIGRAFVTADLFYSRMNDFGTAVLPGVNPAFAQWSAPAAIPDGARAPIEGAVKAALGSGITRLSNGSTAYVLSFGNAGEAREWGSELSAGAHLTKAVRLDANYTFYNFRLEQGSFAAGDSILPNTPSNSANLSATYEVDEGLRVRVGVRVDERYTWRSGLWAGTVPASQTVDVNAGYAIGDQVRLDLIATNLFDQRRFHLFGGSIVGRRILATLAWRR